MKDLAHNLGFHKLFNGETAKQNNLSKTWRCPVDLTTKAKSLPAK
jgi:hypothetical protein